MLTDARDLFVDDLVDFAGTANTTVVRVRVVVFDRCRRGEHWHRFRCGRGVDVLQPDPHLGIGVRRREAFSWSLFGQGEVMIGGRVMRIVGFATPPG